MPHSAQAFAMLEFDDGSGSALFVGGNFTLAGGVSAHNIAKWDGANWSALGSGMECSPGTPFCEENQYGAVRCLLGFDDGSGSALYAGGEFSIAGGVTAQRLARWNGSSWSPVGGSPFDDWVSAMAIFDDGSGDALYVGGWYGLEASGETFISKWNGTSWSAIDGRLNGVVSAILPFDDGTGAALYVLGLFTTAGGTAVNGIAKWDGSTWSPLGSRPVFPTADAEAQGLIAFDDGAGPALYAASDGVQRWDGVNWSEVGGLSCGYPKALVVFDDGSGPALYAGGDLRNDLGCSVEGVAKWDGENWLPLGTGVLMQPGEFQSVETFAVSAVGSDRASLFVGGDFSIAGGAAAQNIARWVDCNPGLVNCFGDGFDSLVTTDCPCGNFGDRRNGCANSNPALGGAHLDATGTKSPNTVLLSCTGIPNGNLCTFLRSTGNNPSGAVFGDGVSCISGPIVRFGQQFAGQDWNEAYTVQAEPVAVAPGNTRYYAVQYRNPAPAFCPGGAFNVSNAYVIHW